MRTQNTTVLVPTHKAWEELRPAAYRRARLKAITIAARNRCRGGERRIAEQLHVFEFGHVPVWRALPGARVCIECGKVEAR